MTARPGSSFRSGRHRVMPAPSESYLYQALRDGRSLEEIAASLGLTRKSIRRYIALWSDGWATRPPRTLVDDERRVVVRREGYVGNAYRMLTISLPRNTMHDLARAEVRHV